MFNTALRRTARSCPCGSLPSRPTTPSIASFTSHSRRHSSSKPPVPPNNGSPAIPASSVKQVGASRSESKKPASESRLSKRKTASKAEPVEEIPQDNWTATLPSVPTTHHLNPKDLSIAAFYATYRPISITGPGPREAQMEDLEKMFQPKPKLKLKASAQTDVIYTLSSALENLDQQISDKQSSQQDANVLQKADLIKTLTQHNDANSEQGDNQNQTITVRVPNGAVKLVIQEIQNRFRPFNVPPPPTPATQEELNALATEQAADEASEDVLAADLEAQIEGEDANSAAARGRRDRRKIEAQLRRNSQSSPQQGKPLSEIPVAEVFANRGDTFSIEMDMQNGHFFTPQYHYDGNAPDAPRPAPSHRGVKTGNRIRRGFFVPVRIRAGVRGGQPMMKLISVRRQRKLKMKKHKYKKLMRKTRNLRKKEGRL